jgi:serine/threonine protein kinase/streptogramin lyase
MAHLEGTRLGAYEIIERIGSGGMAEVYRAKQRTAFDREVAIKVIRKGYADDEDFRARFLREARAISHLAHLNILPLIEFGEGGENDEMLFLVMPYVAGGTLRDRIKKQGGPLPLRDTARIFSQLCEALEHAHQHGLIHRDIKPSNVLLQDGRNVLLADFGIALDTGDARLTSTGMGLGTAEYMAPEQAKGQADRRSDVYSMGVVLYVMLTGQAPYAGSTPFDVLLKHATEPLPSLRSLNPEVPTQIEEVVKTAMAKAPQDRFQSMQAMLNAFENAMIQLGPQALSAMQWSGSVPVVRLPGGNSAPGASAPQSYPPGSGPAAPISGPSGATPASGPHSGPSATPLSGPQGGIEDMPTIRRGATDGSGQAGQMIGSVPGGRVTNPELPAVNPGRVTDPELPTIVGSDQATSATRLEPTSLPAQPQAPVAVAGQVPSVNNLPAPALPPSFPPMPSAPLPATTPPPVAAPPAPPPVKKRSMLLIAALIVLVIVLLGTSALAGVYFLGNRGKTVGATATSQPGTATTPRSAIIANTPCTQAAQNPGGPSANPGSYATPTKITDGQGGSPAFIAASNKDGSVYYSDQGTRTIYQLSPGIPSHPTFATIPGISQPSGVVITPDDPYPIYYLWQDLAGQQAIGYNLTTKITGFPDAGSENAPGFGPLIGFALGMNPSNDALLVPIPSNGSLSCLSKGSGTLTPFITGLKHPVAAAVDAAGNIYVADDGTNRIISFNHQTARIAWQMPFTLPEDLIIDKDGYLVATLLGGHPGDGSIVRIDPRSGQVVSTLASGLQQPRGVTLNTTFYHTGSIYFVDQGANSINELLYTHQ